jgi:hypothetical protein
MAFRAAVAAAACALALGSSVSARADTGSWHTLAHPIDPAQQTALPFGYRSHWLQPWRAYLDTPPASRLRHAVGINFNVAPADAGATAKRLAASGFTRARFEVPWGAMSYEHPDQLQNPAWVDAKLAALRDNGIRPLILLNSNDADPVPTRFFSARVLAPAAPGTRTVLVDKTTAQQLVPGLSGFDGPDGTAAQYMATSVSPTGLVTLSQPLQVGLAAGPQPAATLRYQPFGAPLTSTGAPNALFQQTLAGWLQYVHAVTAEAQRVLGSDNFDVEVWNELSFGSDFLYAGRYYNPVPAAMQGKGDVTATLLSATIGYLRDPANGVPDIGIGDGFASQTPFAAGSTGPAGLTAIDKHPYEGMYSYPVDQKYNNQRPVDALGDPDGFTDPFGAWHDSFIPFYRAFFPEYFLSGIQTEYLERDLSPITSTISGVAHGRDTESAGATAPPRVWVTETNINPSAANALTTADKWHLKAKAALRTLSAFVNKGVSGLYFYAVNDGDWAMIDSSAADGGATMEAVKRFTQAFAGPASISTPRSLSLQGVADQANHTQFAGDGTPGRPPLYNRDVTAFLPFQTDDHKFVVPVYVMTRDMATLYRPAAAASDVTRYDLPPESYRFTIGGVNAAALQATATDPMTGQSVPVTVVSRSESTAVVQMNLTDYPRLLVLQDG